MLPLSRVGVSVRWMLGVVPPPNPQPTTKQKKGTRMQKMVMVMVMMLNLKGHMDPESYFIIISYDYKRVS